MAQNNQEKIKILICGDVEGRFNALFNRVDNINKKNGPFELLLCVGNFFGINNTEFDGYRNGIKKAPIPTYVLGPNKEEHVKLYKKDELCPNVYYLGKRGLYTSSGGLKIAYISGLNSDSTNRDQEFTYNVEDVLALRDLCVKDSSNYRGVDMLITSQWPNNVTKGDKKVNLKQNIVSDLVSWLSTALKPRYHVAGLEGLYYERAPYRIRTNDSEAVTRFLGLARVGNPSKDKWLYALNLTPVDKLRIIDIRQRTTDETGCPYDLEDLEVKCFKKKRRSDSQYFYDMNPVEGEEKKFKHKRQKVEFDQSKCWFCLASPSVEKHLVITVGTYTYLALAKGGLVDEHFLICPIEHLQCSVGQPEEIDFEVQQFKEALTKFYNRRDRVPVFFERNYKTSHMQIQAVPVPKNALNNLEDIFKDEAQGHGVQLNKLDEHNKLEQVVKRGAPYFVVELPNGVTLYTRIQSGSFPLNFAREVLAIDALLDLNDRTDWKDCLLSKEEEVELVARIRTDFEPFDFTET